MEQSWLTVLPSLLAIFFAILTKRIIWSLIGGIILGFLLLNDFSLFDSASAVFGGFFNTVSDAGNIKVTLFTLLIGALFSVLEKSGSFTDFIRFLEAKSMVKSRRSAGFFTWIIGVIIFIESNVTIMLAGATSRPIYDKLKISREKLAYIIDSTSAPICILIPLNGWGAYNLALLNKQEVINPLQTFIESIAYNFYAIFAVLIALIVALFNWNIGPMKGFERRAMASSPAEAEQSESNQNENLTSGLTAVLLSLLTLVLLVPVSLYVTGNGSIVKGSGSTSVLVAVTVSYFFASMLTLHFKKLTLNTWLKSSIQGVIKILPIATILLLAITLGDVTKIMGTGRYVASLLNSQFPQYALLAVLFLLAAFTAFSIGSSWGTFAIMIPLAVPLAVSIDAPLAPFIAAAISGGIFGDHSSPISDTTVMASLAADTDHIDHVKSQLPYALLAGVGSIAMYLVIGLSL